MLTMTKKRKRARDRGEVIPLLVELDPELHEALLAQAKKDLRTRKAVTVLALQEYLTRQGTWPPASRKKGGE